MMPQIKDLTVMVTKAILAKRDAQRVKDVVSLALNTVGHTTENRIALQKVIAEKNVVIIKNTITLKLDEILHQVDNLADFGRTTGDGDLYDKMAKIGDQLSIIMEDHYNATK